MSAAPKSCGNDRRRFRPARAIARVARKLWPAKTAAHLAASSGASQRSAENWLSGCADPSGDNLAALLRSDEGFDFLSELMDGAETRWWRAVRLRVRLAELERRSAETKLLLDEMREHENSLGVAGGSLAAVHGGS